VKLLVPGRFTTTSIKTPDGGELEVRLTDGGHWQIKAKLAGEGGWRPLCRGHIDGSIFDAARPDDLAPVKVGPLLVDPAGRRVEVRGVELRLTAHEYELIALLATEPNRVFTKQELLRELWGAGAPASSARSIPTRAGLAASCATPAPLASSSTATATATSSPTSRSDPRGYPAADRGNPA
jgi:Transcriptional regulatory protein, C terminal